MVVIRSRGIAVHQRRETIGGLGLAGGRLFRSRGLRRGGNGCFWRDTEHG
jgi:hypothetical protein